MKTPFSNTLIAASILGLSSLTGFAEGKGGGNGFIQAAEKYEAQAREAHAAGNLKDATIYHKLGQIKRAAAAAQQQGKGFSWDEYHKLAGQLSGKTAGKKDHAKKGHAKKKDHGGGFNSAAERYAKQAAEARAAGNAADAQIYDRLAQIKRDAAAHRGGKPFDWGEYHKLAGQLSGKQGHKKQHDKKHHDKKAHDKKAHNKGGGGFLKTAEKYTAMANQAMQNGDERKARIYTQLAAMKREAAAAAVQGKNYDWSVYFKLKDQLKK